jgi:hypothetical protein
LGDLPRLSALRPEAKVGMLMLFSCVFD